MKRTFKRLKKRFKQRGGFTRKCGKGKIECSKDTVNFGLCVDEKRPELCNTLDYDPKDKAAISLPEFCMDDIVEFADDIIRGKEKRYSPHNFINPCSNKNDDNVTVIQHESGDTVPSGFSVITINAMGIYRGKDPVIIDNHGNYTGENPSLILMALRAKIVRDFLIEQRPDMIFFQEMSEYFFRFLYTKQIEDIYPHFFEEKLDWQQSRSKDIEVFILSKYKPKKISVIALTGNLDYTDSLGIYEFENLVVVNAYLQAGSRASPGQKYFWQDFSRCRSQQLGYVKKQIDPFIQKNIGVIVLGDFNFDINSIGTEDEQNWPEGIILKSLGLKDSWKGKDWKEGLTENTELNTLRFNSKLEPKMFRYDAIFYSKSLRLSKSKVILNQGVPLKTQRENDAYETVIIPGSVKSNPKLMGKIIKNDNGGYDLFASDHFGVMSTFTFGITTKPKQSPRLKTRRIR